MQLFRAYSVVDGYKGDDGRHYDGVRVGWYVFDRREPVAPYELLVADYRDRDLHLESVANELFTRSQVNELRQYLHARYGIDLVAQAVQLPVRGLPVGLSGVEPCEGKGEQDWLLCADAGYPLSFLAVGLVELHPFGEILKGYFDFSEEPILVGAA